MSLLSAMLVEEWRLHAQLFGGRRFAAFPAVMFVLGAAGLTLLGELGVARGAVVGGLHAVVAFLGLQVGTIGLVGRDAMRNVLGDVSLLVGSSRTLPISWRRVLATFLLKDLLYYAGLILGPLALADAARALVQGTSPIEVGLLWMTLVFAFALGVTVSLAMIAVATRSVIALLASVTGFVAVVVLGNVDPITFTPAGFYGTPSVASGLRVTGLIVVSATIALALFEPIETSERASRTPPLPVGFGIAGRTLREVARSSGSVWKVLFSLSLFGGVTGWLLVAVADAGGLEIAPGLAFGTLLGLGTFTTYAWVTQFDDPGEFDRYPLAPRTLFRGKLLAFLTLAIPAGLVVLAVAAVWFPPAELAIGVAILPAVAIYVYGVSATVAGLSPTALLFDVARFAVFGAAIALVAVPLVVTALIGSRYPTLAPVLGLAIAVLAGTIGLVLAEIAGQRWDRRRR
ncbi:hypothetical protein [Halorhabdus sp. BNX81]|uniref:hypothetical protein n=1 Tax=Halorhabdus sp. BNX81 TaxID=2980181 RepID=UPI0023DD5E0E|nr:hypothetical protein [Halorhabdus sp. BNX81]WEL21280.1 putative membrane protein, predicted permease [Halorhabdus sp. BNX81]